MSETEPSLNETASLPIRSPSRVGYWASHKYHRRKVETDILKELGGFVGWNYMTDLCGRAEPRVASLIATTFETGGRIAEIVGNKHTGICGLIKKQFRPHPHNPDFTEVRAMEVEKLKEEDKEVPVEFGEKGKKIKHWKRKIGYRNISIRQDEPLVPIMLNWVGQLESPEDKLFTFSPTWAYVLLTKLDKSIWCHWLRAQRACQLVEDYNFDVIALKKFFGWEFPDTPLIYASLSRADLEERMARSDVIRVKPKIEELKISPEPKKRRSFTC